MRVRTLFAVVTLILVTLSGASLTLAAPEGTMTLEVHVTLVSRWLDPAETEGLITPFRGPPGVNGRRG